MAVALVSIFLIWVGAAFVIRRQRRRARERRMYSGVYGAAVSATRRGPGGGGDDLEAYEREKGYGVELAPSAGSEVRPSSGLVPGAQPPAAAHFNEKEPAGGAQDGSRDQDQYGAGTSYAQQNYGQAYGSQQAQGQQQGESYAQPSAPRAPAQHQPQPSQDYADAYGGQYDAPATQQAYDANTYGQQQPYAADYSAGGSDYPRGTAYAAAARQQGQYQYTGTYGAYGSDQALAQAQPGHGQQEQAPMSHAYNSPAVAYGTAR